MRHIELNSVSAGFENCGITWARGQFVIKSALTSAKPKDRWIENNNFINRKIWKFYTIVYQGFATDLLWNNSVFIADKGLTIARFLWLIGREKSAPNIKYGHDWNRSPTAKELRRLCILLR